MENCHRRCGEGERKRRSDGFSDILFPNHVGITPAAEKKQKERRRDRPMAFDSAMVVTVSESAAKNKSDDRIPVIMPAAAAYIGYFSLPQE